MYILYTIYFLITWYTSFKFILFLVSLPSLSSICLAFVNIFMTSLKLDNFMMCDFLDIFEQMRWFAVKLFEIVYGRWYQEQEI